MSDYWFKPKTHGYGAVPINWKGWAAIVAFVFAVMVLTWPLVVQPSIDGAEASILQVVVWLLGLAVLIGIFIRVCREKTDGSWKWR